MKTDVFNLNGEKAETIDLPDEIFGAKVNIDLMHQAYQRQMANARLGTHSTKRRGEVSGGGAKPWKQKGTGRARQGSRISAQWVGGGRIFTPKPRDHSLDMPKKMRHAALRSALTVKANDQQLVFVKDLNMSQAKTSELAKVVNKLAGEGQTLILIADKGEANANVIKSGRNLVKGQLLFASYVNIRDLLRSEKVIIPLDSLNVLKTILG